MIEPRASSGASGFGSAFGFAAGAAIGGAAGITGSAAGGVAVFTVPSPDNVDMAAFALSSGGGVLRTAAAGIGGGIDGAELRAFGAGVTSLSVFLGSFGGSAVAIPRSVSEPGTGVGTPGWVTSSGERGTSIGGCEPWGGRIGGEGSSSDGTAGDTSDGRAGDTSDGRGTAGDRGRATISPASAELVEESLVVSKPGTLAWRCVFAVDEPPI